MSPDPAELAPSRDPAAYGRRPLFTGVFFAWISLCLVCVLAGAAIARFALPPEFGRKAEPARVETPKTAPAAEPPVTPSAAAPPAATPADPGLADRVARLEGAQGRTDHAAASALAAASLSDAAATSRPFADEPPVYRRHRPLSKFRFWRQPRRPECVCVLESQAVC